MEVSYLRNLLRSEFFVFEVVRMNEFQHRIAEQEWALYGYRSAMSLHQIGRRIIGLNTGFWVGFVRGECQRG